MEAGRAFYRDLLPRLEQTSGIEAVAIGQPPFSVGLQTSITPEGEHTERFPSPVVIVSPMYFRVLGIPLMRGRLFTATDTAESGPVTIISRSLAAKVWPGQDPIGRRITSNDPARDRKVRWMTVVGVVGDVRNAGLEQPLEADLYEPLDQNRNMDPNNVLVRTSGDPLGSLPAIRSLVHTIDKGRAVTRVATMEERLSRMLAPRRFNLFVIGVFSVLAFVLAVVGIYAVVSQTVAARTREVATRIALGASGARILVLVVRQNLIPIAAGEIIGAGIALGLNRLMQTLVFGVTTTDAPTYVAIGITWTATAVLACVIPASRAMRIDPVVALKCE
jgi:putative ABC transport system permease protein